MLILQRFIHRSEDSEPNVWLPSLGVWHWEEELPEYLALKATRTWSPAIHRTGGKQKYHSWRVHTGPHVHHNPRKKQGVHRRLGQTYLLVLESLLGSCGVAVAHCGDRDTGGSGSGEYLLVWDFLEAAIFSPRPGPTQQPIGPSAGTPQAKQPTGWEHSPSHQQTGCLKSLWAHSCLVNTPLDMALPTRGTRPNFTHQWAGTSPSYQKACTNFLDQPHPPGVRHQKKKELQPCSLRNGNCNHRKLDKMKAEEYVPGGGTR